MRICPLCQATYEDDIEFCFKDGSPLDSVGDDGAGDLGSGEEEFSIHDSVEFMPPDAIGLTGEFEIPDMDDSADEPTGEDGRIKVVPGGLTSPLDDEESIEAPDPFAMPILAPGQDVLAMVSGEIPVRPGETLEAEAPDLTEEDSISGGHEPVEPKEPPPEVAPQDEPPPEEPPPEEPPPEEEQEDEAPPEARKLPTESDSLEVVDERARTGTAWLDEVEDPAGPAAVPPAPGFTDPLYEALPVDEKTKKKRMVWWIGIGIAALIAIGFLVYSVATRGGSGRTGGIQPTLTVDTTPEERPTARPPIHREDPTPEGLDEDATEGLDEDPTDGLDEPPTALEERPTESPLDVEAATPEPATPEPVTPEPATPEPPTPAVADPADPANPWLAAANNPTTEQPADPTNPWAAAANTSQSGKVTVSSTPVGAGFFVDGQSKGTTPLTVDVEYGHHTIRVEKDGHVSQERPVSVQSGTVFVDFTLEKVVAPTTGKLTVFTNPQPGATLFVDGAARGKTPVTLDITPGVHSLRVELAGFPTKEESIDLSDLQPGENRRRVISME